MTKAPTIKFPRIEAGFYNVTRDGELMGYISKKVDGKETSWVVYNTKEVDLSQESLPISSIVDETELFREAKEFSKKFFSELPQEDIETEESEEEVEVETVVLQEPEWNETDVEEVDDSFVDRNEENMVENEEQLIPF